MSKTPESKPKQVRNKKYMLVRYGRMNLLGFFEHHESKIPKVATGVVVKTDKGLELGHLVGPLCSYKAGQFKLSENDVNSYFGECQIDLPRSKGGKFVRYATHADTSEQEHLQIIARDEVECCRALVNELNLPMKIVDAEHILGGERVVFYFMSDGRVDFRDLVKQLAHEYQTRIEMRQIGARDEAKLLGDIESCGQECCCKRFLRQLKPVNMRMAKMQKATLDPAKISGYCGRLKCCLRYEDKTYTELKKQLPRRNSWVKTEKGEGRVVNTQILTQLAVVEYDGGARIAVPVDEIEVIAQTRPPSPKKEDDAGKDKKPGEDKKEPRGGKGRRRGRDRNASKNEKRGNGQENRRGNREERKVDNAKGPKQDKAQEKKQDTVEAPNQAGAEDAKQDLAEAPKQGKPEEEQ